MRINKYQTTDEQRARAIIEKRFDRLHKRSISLIRVLQGLIQGLKLANSRYYRENKAAEIEKFLQALIKTLQGYLGK